MTLVQHIENLLYYALTLTKDMDEARELLQELAVAVFSDPLYYQSKPQDEVKKIMVTIIKRTHYQKWRRYSKYSSILNNLDKKQPENDVWERMQKYDLQKALLSVSKKSGVCFRLRLDGYKNPEISKILNMPKVNIVANVIRAKKQLKEILAA